MFKDYLHCQNNRTANENSSLIFRYNHIYILPHRWCTDLPHRRDVCHGSHCNWSVYEIVYIKNDLSTKTETFHHHRAELRSERQRQSAAYKSDFIFDVSLLLIHNKSFFFKQVRNYFPIFFFILYEKKKKTHFAAIWSSGKALLISYLTVNFRVNNIIE